MDKRQFLAAGMGLGLGLMATSAAVAQQPVPTPPRRRTAKTTPVFKAPPGFPNAIAVAPEGVWVAEQRDNTQPSADRSEKVWLVDWQGKVLKTVVTQSRNTSGMAYGGGNLWMGLNATPNGILQVDLNGKEISHRQIPLGPPNNGGGCHGLLWQDGKLWISALRLGGMLRVDPATWTPEFLIQSPAPRMHGMAWDNGAIWMVTGTVNDYRQNKPGLAKFDATTGQLLELVDFAPGSGDPHGLAMYNGQLYSCDAGIAPPGFSPTSSPTAGWIFRIDFV
jgi:hypothetical protein